MESILTISENGSTDSCTISDPPSDQRNSSGPEYNADDECSGIKESKSTTVLKTDNHQKNKRILLRESLDFMIQKLKVLTLSGKLNELKSCDSCGCDAYIKGESSKVSLSDGKQGTKLPNLPVCSLENKCAKWIETTFLIRYGCEFTEDLLFAIDTVLLARSLNGLNFRYILYPFTSKAPKSPYPKTIDEAFISILKACNEEFEKQFNLAINGEDITYRNFQNVLLKEMKDWEETPYNAKEFLMHTAMVVQWTVCAERKGVRRATYFSPLVICRTISRLRIWEKVTQTFWKDLTEAAKFFLDLNCKPSFECKKCY